MNRPDCGILPTEFKVLVEPKPVATKIGNIHIPDQKVEKDEWATTEGWIRAIAPGAFKYLNEDEWEGRKPQIGDHVIFAKYAGLRVTGNDGKDYILLVDKDLCAVRKA